MKLRRLLVARPDPLFVTSQHYDGGSISVDNAVHLLRRIIPCSFARMLNDLTFSHSLSSHRQND
jgi:hypothetical protein